MTTRVRAAIVGALLALLPAAARAAAPQRTTATYSDWTVRCTLQNTAKTCEMVQTTHLKGHQEAFTLIAIGRSAADKPTKIVFQVPVNVWVSTGVKLTDAGKVLVAAGFQRCVAAGCFAQADLSPKLIGTLSRQDKPGHLRFESAARRTIAVPVLFKGFPDAYAVLSH